MRRTLILASSLLLMTACTSSAEYPGGLKTNAVIGGRATQTGYPATRNADVSPAAGEGLLHTKPAKGGDNAICVGAWCSCDTQ